MICQSEPGNRNRSRISCTTKVVWLYSGSVPKGTTNTGAFARLRKRISRHSQINRAGRQEAHVFDYFTMMKRIAVSAALGALVLAGSLQPAHAQAAGAAAAPQKKYAQGEYEMYD